MNTISIGTILLYSLALITESGFSQTTQWKSMGPGSVSVMASSPTDPSEIITGSAKSGVFKSTDRGQTWNFSGTGLPVGDSYLGPDVTALRYDPTTPSIIYAGTGWDETSTGRGLFKSTNGGQTWTAINNGLPNSSTVRSIDVSIFDPQIVFASIIGGFGERGLYKSTNGGQNWASCLQYSSESGPVMVDRNVQGSLFFVDGLGTFYRSTDYGASWSQTMNNLQMYGVRRIIRKGTTGPFFFTSTYRGAFKSLDGQNIYPINSGLPVSSESNARFWDIVLDSTYLFISTGDSGLYRSSDDGASWHRVFDYATQSILIVQNEIIIGTNAGLFKSTDGGINWSFVTCDIGSGLVADVEVGQTISQFYLQQQAI